MTAIKERPILFSAPMVRAILDGRKTVTRRPVKTDWIQSDLAPLNTAPGLFHFWCSGEHACPYGEPGQRLWVRESHAQVFEVDIPHGRYAGPIGTAGSPGKPDWKSRYVYRADGEMPNVQWHHVGDSQPVRWTPSIHMPRAACRILLEITDVRVERLQDISEEQAVAEGLIWQGQENGKTFYSHAERKYPPGAHQQFGISGVDAVSAFRNLWNSVGGEWDANPWVWVVEFKRVQP
jgi:hypothetical protein